MPHALSPTWLRLLAGPLAAIVLGLALSACGGGGVGLPPDPADPVGTCGSGGGPPVTLTGRVRYIRLVLGPLGLGPGTQTRAARHVDVEVRNAVSGACYGRGSTNASGDYSLTVMPAAGATIEVVALSRTLEAPGYDIFVHAADPPNSNTHSETNVFSYASAPFLAASQTADITVPYNTGPASRPSIGFGLLDTCVTCWDALAGANATPTERAHLYTRVGNNFVLQNTSYYSTSTRSLAILGGASGLPDDSDTDYFDDAVAAHEFQHFVGSLLSFSMSRGGSHNGTEIEPPFAWGEGSATGFGCLMLGVPDYIDTSKTDANKSLTLLFVTSAENATTWDPDGIGCEFTMMEILWDLADGVLDTDGDGVNATLAELYAASKSFNPAVDGPYIGLFLERLVGLSAISATQMGTFLTSGPEDQQISFPPVGDDVWPKPIALGGAGSGTLTTVGLSNPCRALAASHWYQFTLAAPAVVSIDLTITPLAGSGDNLNLYLARNANVNLPIASSTNFGATNESINASLGAGTYILRVEAVCGTDNRASYNLTIN